MTTITTITSGNKEFLAVEMPEGASNIKLVENVLRYQPNPILRGFKLNYLPEGNYKIIGLCSEIMGDEQLALQVIEQGTEGNYMRRYDYMTDTFAFMTYGASFASFMTKHSLTESTLLIEKI